MKKSSRDVNFWKDDLRFNFRVVACIRCEDKMILTHTDDFDFWNMPGGRVKFGESTLEALKRELYEELDLVPDEEPKLLVVYENFFEWEGQEVQELEFIYRVDVDKSQLKRLENFRVKDSKNNERTYWFTKEQVRQHVCLPKIIYDMFDLPTDKITHSVNKD